MRETSNTRHHPLCCHCHCLPATLVAVAIALAAVAIALFVACHPHCHCHCPCGPHPCPLHCPPALLLSPLPMLLLSSLPSPLLPSLARHHRCHRSCRQSHCSLRCTPPLLSTLSPSTLPLPSHLPLPCCPCPLRHMLPLLVDCCFLDGGGLGPSFAHLIQQTMDSSNVTGSLSFNAFAFFATNLGAPTNAPGVGADRISHLYYWLGGAFTVSQHAEI